MSIADDVTADVTGVLDQPWDIRDGEVVPEQEDVALGGGGVKLEAVMLYADLADSTRIAMDDRRIAAKLFKAFLAAASRLIRHRDGYVRSFDGDRVMGVFITGGMHTNAAICGLNIAWAIANVIRPQFKAAYKMFQDNTYGIDHCTGIDRSEVLVVRAGIRGNNDLGWVGRAPNVAAKLSSIRVNSDYTTYITDDVHGYLLDEATHTVKPENGKQDMWEKYEDSSTPVTTLYRSRWYRSPVL
jgi:class 3 adenylate cyclase